jgi:DNA-binding MarR family transcriptional regulator
MPEPEQLRGPWALLTNHAHVILCLADAPEARLREVAVRIGITERAVQRIVTELVQSGFITRTRKGRRNRYQVHREKGLELPIGRKRSVGDLMTMVLADSPA